MYNTIKWLLIFFIPLIFLLFIAGGIASGHTPNKNTELSILFLYAIGFVFIVSKVKIGKQNKKSILIISLSLIFIGVAALFTELLEVIQDGFGIIEYLIIGIPLVLFILLFIGISKDLIQNGKN